MRWLALERDGWKCRVCQRRGRMEVDHIQPVSKGRGTRGICPTFRHFAENVIFRSPAEEYTGVTKDLAERDKWRRLVEQG